MFNQLTKLLNFYLYSSIHISLATALLIYISFVIANVQVNENFLIFGFASTLAMYSLHRIVGMNKVKSFEATGRFAIISQYRSHIILYAVAASGVSAYYFFRLDSNLQTYLILPIILSILYVVPVFLGKRRLRDFPFIKILLIASIWSWVTSYIPSLEQNTDFRLLQLVERFCFIFAITIPFDLRDMEVDKATNVKTIPLCLGAKKSITTALIFLFLSITAATISLYLGYYDRHTWSGAISALLIASFLVYKSRAVKSDYYYSGILDGTMILYPTLILVFKNLL